MGQRPIELEIDGRLKEALEVEARLSNSTQSEIASEAIRHFLEQKRRKRDMLAAAVAEANKGVFISGEAMHRWIESWDTENELPPPEPDIFLAPRK